MNMDAKSKNEHLRFCSSIARLPPRYHSSINISLAPHAWFLSGD